MLILQKQTAMVCKKIEYTYQKLGERNNEELLKNQRKFQTIAAILAEALILVFISALYISIQKGFTPLVIIPIVLTPILFKFFRNIHSIKTELKSRKE